jgi:amidophosphoribosyltransferase
VGDGWVLSSETCALDIIGAEVRARDRTGRDGRDHRRQGVESHFPFRPAKPRFCIFEHVYFSRPDSIIWAAGRSMKRAAIGANWPAKPRSRPIWSAPCPTAARPRPSAYSHESGIPYAMGIIRNQYMGRTFIEPTEQIRNMGVRLKLNVNRALIEGKRVILVDDSVVRGTTSRKIKEMILDAGAARCISASPARRPPGPVFTASTRPSAKSCWPRPCPRTKCASIWPWTACKFISLDGLYRAVGEAERAAIRTARNIAMPVFRANTLSSPPT